MHRNPKSGPQQLVHQDDRRAHRQLTVCRFQIQGTIRELETLEDMLCFLWDRSWSCCTRSSLYGPKGRGPGVRLSLE